MSVIFSTKQMSGRWRHLWPLAWFLFATLIVLYAVWHYWPNILLNSAAWQKSINQQFK